jgi:hypothetical protein
LDYKDKHGASVNESEDMSEDGEEEMGEEGEATENSDYDKEDDFICDEDGY